MQLTEDQTDQRSLSTFGSEAAMLLASRDFRGLADRFGYALAYGRDPAKAIEADLAACLSEADEGHRAVPSGAVKYFKPNDANLFAVVECVAHMPEGTAFLVELIVTRRGAERHVTLEDISLI